MISLSTGDWEFHSDDDLDDDCHSTDGDEDEEEQSYGCLDEDRDIDESESSDECSDSETDNIHMVGSFLWFS